MLALSLLQVATLLTAASAFNDPLPPGYVETGPFGTVSPGASSYPSNFATIKSNALTAAKKSGTNNCFANGKTTYNFNFNPSTKFFAQGTTFVAFGDSWTTDGSNGVNQTQPPTCANGSPWKPSANCSYETLHGRACEGYEWPEYMSQTYGLTLHDYAISGAYTDKSLYGNLATDYMDHYTTYKSQNLKLNYDTTTFTIFYGINDWFAGFPSDDFPNGQFPNADFVGKGLPSLLNKVKNTLVAEGAKNLLFIGLPQWGGDYPDILLQWQATLSKDINVSNHTKDSRLSLKHHLLGFVTLWPLFQDVGGDDASKGGTFGFSQGWTGQCVEYGTKPDAEFFRQCDLDDLYWSFANAHPTTRMHSLMAAYIKSAIDGCSAVPAGAPAGPGIPCKNANGQAKAYINSVMNDFIEFGRDPSTGDETGCGCFFRLEDFYQEALIIESVINYAWFTGDTDAYQALLNGDFSLDESPAGGIPSTGTFRDGHDDALWWALAFIKLHEYQGGKDLTWIKQAKVLMDWAATDQAKGCADGIWWKTNEQYKNTIVNGLYIYAAAKYSILMKDSSYLTKAQVVWNWVTRTGLRNAADLLYNDGATDSCTNNGQTYWTYNQGIMIGAAGILYVATGNFSYITWANQTAYAVTHGPKLSSNGILSETCDGGNTCNHDQHSFKGIFMQHLQYFLDSANDQSLKNLYGPWIGNQIRAIKANADDGQGNSGSNWAAKSPQYFGDNAQFMGIAAANAAAKYGTYTGTNTC